MALTPYQRAILLAEQRGISLTEAIVEIERTAADQRQFGGDVAAIAAERDRRGQTPEPDPRDVRAEERRAFSQQIADQDRAFLDQRQQQREIENAEFARSSPVPEVDPTREASVSGAFGTRDRSTGLGREEENLALERAGVRPEAIRGDMENYYDRASRRGFAEIEPDSLTDAGIKFVENLDDTAGRWVGGFISAIPETSQNLNPLNAPLESIFGPNVLDTPIDEWLRSEGRDISERAARELERNSPNGTTARIAYDAANGFIDLGMTIGATALTRSPNVGAAVMGARVMGDRYGQSVREGRTTEQAFVDGVVYGLAEALGERVVIGQLMRPGGRITAAARGAAAEAMQEAATEAFQTAYDAGIIGEEMTLEQAVERMAYAGLIGGIVGGGTGLATGDGLGRSVDRRNQLAQDRARERVVEDISTNAAAVEALAPADRAGRQANPADPANINSVISRYAGASPLRGGTTSFERQADIASPIDTDLIDEGRELTGLDLPSPPPPPPPRRPRRESPGARLEAAPAREAVRQRIRVVESSGNDAAQNPRSSASGRYQFTNDTFVAMHEQVFGGTMSRAQRLRQKNNPQVQERLMDALLDANEAALRRGGQEITAGNLYLAHFLGSGGALRVLTAAPGTPIEAALGERGPAVVRANPFLRGMTAADVANWAASRMAGTRFTRGQDNVSRETEAWPERERFSDRTPTIMEITRATLGDDFGRAGEQPTPALEEVEVERDGQRRRAVVEERSEFEGVPIARVRYADGGTEEVAQSSLLPLSPPVEPAQRVDEAVPTESPFAPQEPSEGLSGARIEEGQFGNLIVHGDQSLFDRIREETGQTGLRRADGAIVYPKEMGAETAARIRAIVEAPTTVAEPAVTAESLQQTPSYKARTPADDPPRFEISKYIAQRPTDGKAQLVGRRGEDTAFYSVLEDAVETAPSSEATADRWVALLQPGKVANLTKEELDWTGITDWLAAEKAKRGAGAKISRDEVLAAARAGGLVLEEAEASDDWMEGYDPEVDERARELRDADIQEELNRVLDRQEIEVNVPEIEEIYDSEGESSEPVAFEFDGDEYPTMEAAMAAREAAVEQAYRDAEADLLERIDDGYDWSPYERQAAEELNRIPQWGSYTTSDGNNDNYRELLLRLPPGEGANPDRAPSSHWDASGVIAHVRMQDKQAFPVGHPDGAPWPRVLLLEEVQSDWHQKGRKQGYEVKLSQEEMDRREREKERAEEAYTGAVASAVFTYDRREDYYLDQMRAEAERHMAEGRDENWLRDRGIPTLSELEAIREGQERERAQPPVTRMVKIRQSVERDPRYFGWGVGAEKLAALPEPAKRFKEAYDLMEDLRVAYTEAMSRASRSREGGAIPNAPLKDWEKMVLRRMLRYAVDKGYDALGWTNGSEQAQRWRGEEGLQPFYDKKLVDIANKLVKPYGAKVEQMEVNDPGDLDGPHWVLRITPELANAIGGKPQPLYRLDEQASAETLATPASSQFADALNDPNVEPRELVELLPKVEEEIGLYNARLQKILNSLGVKAKLDVKAIIGGSPKGGEADAASSEVALGYFIPDENRILIGLAFNDDPYATVDHEAVHYFKNAGVFTKTEWKMLVDRARSDPELDEFVALYGDQPSEVIDEERVAEMFARWRADKGDVIGPDGRPIETPKTFIDRVFTKLMQVIDAIRLAVGTGSEAVRFREAVRVMEKISAGEMGARVTAQAPQSTGARAALRRSRNAFPDANVEANYLVDRTVGPPKPAGMTPSDYDLYSRKMLLDDLDWKAAAGETLPYGFTPDSLREAKAKIDTLIGKNEKVANAVRRQKFAELLAEQAELQQAERITDAPEPTTMRHGKGPVAGNVRLDRLETTDAIKGAIDEVQKGFDGFRDARRGRVTNEEVREFARETGLPPRKLLNRARGEAWNAENLFAARELLVASADDLVQRAQAARGGDDAAVLAFRKAWMRHVAIQEQVAGLTAEAGRALNQFNMMARAGGDVNARMLREIIDIEGGRQDLEAIAQIIVNSAGDPAKLNRFARDSFNPTMFDKIFELWINGLLSGPATHVVNAVSNSITAVTQVPEYALASLIGKARSLVTGDADRITGSEVGARAIGLLTGAREGAKLFADAVITGEGADVMSKIEARHQQAISGTKGKIIRIPSRMLLAADEFYKGVAGRMELNAQAVREAEKEGLTGEARKERIKELAANPTEEMMERVTDYARYVTFTNALGPKGQATMNWLNKLHLRWLVPFVRTPTNIFKYAIARSPAAPLLKEVRDDFRAGGLRRDLAIARVAFGTGLGMVIYQMALEGLITGGEPPDEERRRMLRATGWQPYSFKIGDSYYSYARLDPLATIIGVAADIAGVHEHMSDEERDEAGLTIVALIGNQIKNKTFLQGIGNALEAFEDPNRYGTAFIARLAGTVVPTGVAHAATATDPTLRDTRVNRDETAAMVEGSVGERILGRGLAGALVGVTRASLNQIRSRIPGVSNDLPARRDVWGAPIVREGSIGPDYLSPFWVATDRNDPVTTSLLEAGANLGPPSRSITVDGERRELSAAEYDAYQELAGRYVRADAEAFVGSADWEAMTNEERVEEFDLIKNAAREDARVDLGLSE